MASSIRSLWARRHDDLVQRQEKRDRFLREAEAETVRGVRSEWFASEMELARSRRRITVDPPGTRRRARVHMPYVIDSFRITAPYWRYLQNCAECMVLACDHAASKSMHSFRCCQHVFMLTLNPGYEVHGVTASCDTCHTVIRTRGKEFLEFRRPSPVPVPSDYMPELIGGIQYRFVLAADVKTYDEFAPVPHAHAKLEDAGTEDLDILAASYGVGHRHDGDEKLRSRLFQLEHLEVYGHA